VAMPLTAKPREAKPFYAVRILARQPIKVGTLMPGSSGNETKHVYEVRPRKDGRGFDLKSDVLLFGRLWYGERSAVSNAIGYAQHQSRSHNAVIRVFDAAGNAIETHEHAGDFKEW
jgi:hypothetical protein